MARCTVYMLRTQLLLPLFLPCFGGRERVSPPVDRSWPADWHLKQPRRPLIQSRHVINTSACASPPPYHPVRPPGYWLGPGHQQPLGSRALFVDVLWRYAGTDLVIHRRAPVELYQKSIHHDAVDGGETESPRLLDCLQHAPNPTPTGTVLCVSARPSNTVRGIRGFSTHWIWTDIQWLPHCHAALPL